MTTSSTLFTPRHLHAPIARDVVAMASAAIVDKPAPTQGYMAQAYMAGLNADVIAHRVGKATSWVHAQLRAHPQAETLRLAHLQTRQGLAWIAEKRYWGNAIHLHRAKVPVERIRELSVRYKADWTLPAFTRALNGALKKF